jgi:pyrroloquinoline quinone (PQQ) biosynthesis protein C
METATEVIKRLAESTPSHPALNNPFYDTWLTQRLGFEAAETFLANYCAWIATVTDQIARVFLATSDLRAKCETIKNLYSEMGMGDPEKTHVVMLRRFASALLSRLKGELVTIDERPERLLPTTHRLIEVQQQLFGNAAPQVASGALLSQEWQAYSMLVKLYEGSRLYASLWPTLDEFHESCEYFYIHIGEAEKEHKIQSIKSASQYCHSDSDVALIQEGYHGFLDALANFWVGIHEAIRSGNTLSRPSWPGSASSNSDHVLQ